MPKELNFFDTNPVVLLILFLLSAFSLKKYPSGIRNLYISMCIEVLKRKGRTEPVVVVGIAISNVRVKHTSCIAIIAIATTHNERIRRIFSLIPIIYINNVKI